VGDTPTAAREVADGSGDIRGPARSERNLVAEAKQLHFRRPAGNVTSGSAAAAGNLMSAHHQPLHPWSRGSAKNKTGGVLLFWSVSSNPRIMDIVRKDVDHIRQNFSERVDVFLAHYDHKRYAWQEKMGPWYGENVQFSAERKGFKFQLMQQLLTSRDDLDLKSYSWVWALDEDVDFTGTDMPLLFHDAAKTGALLVLPSFHQMQENRQAKECPTDFPWPSYDGKLCFTKREYATASRRDKGSVPCAEWCANDPSLGSGCGDPSQKVCQHDTLSHPIQVPQPNCQFRYTPLVEVIFPLIRPKALVQILTACDHCIHEKTVWGLNWIWCSFSARRLGHPREKACAILDQVPVLHLNFKTLDGKYDKDRNVNSSFYDQGDADRMDVKRHHPEDWANVSSNGRLKEFSCVRKDGSVQS